MQCLMYWILSSTGADGSWKVDEVSDLDRVLQKAYGDEDKGRREGMGVDPNSLDRGRRGTKSKAQAAKALSSRAAGRVPEPTPSTASTELDAGERRRIQEAEEFERVRGIKRKRELDDIGARERANDRDPRTGAWAPKPRCQDPIWIRKPLKCFPLYVRDFAGVSLDIARLISRTR